ncbi:DUF4430 domain-containing protein [Neobacillus vireti]|uniref:Transcobalamin-like C-terminal domain-containing protein n=1 Tax=Neobacillus vireti LMG 21834 TaxID=1131730 RepID=A0AB94IL55_9BACI|nr:DUF4430 domain-containing protein [Neobacillus vireti]ETI67733.1 hypothetical protein BAVI_16237 [Neobacillus vireti LMG 21834]
MKRILKTTALLFVLFAAFSLAGCGTNVETAKETKKEAVKTEEAAKQAEQTHQEEESAKTDAAGVQQEEPEQSAETASTKAAEKETEQPDAKPETPAQNAPASQAKSETNKANPAASSSNSKSGVAPGKSSSTPAAQPSKPAAPSTPPAAPNTPPPTNPKPETPKHELAVTISIAGPKDRGTILSATKVNFKDGATIFDIISQAAKKQGIIIDSRGSGATAYIEGIDNIYEFDYGVKSGWIFKQNGVSLTKSIGVVKVKDGDRIECFYTE